jgi:hypothetical protein
VKLVMVASVSGAGRRSTSQGQHPKVKIPTSTS